MWVWKQHAGEQLLIRSCSTSRHPLGAGCAPEQERMLASSELDGWACGRAPGFAGTTTAIIMQLRHRPM